MLASYLLSRTLVPILMDVLVKPEYDRRHGDKQHARNEATPNGRLARFHAAFERGFQRFHRGYLGLLHAAIGHRVITFGVAGATVVLAVILLQFVGQDYFPQVDAGQMTLHVRARPGLRIEEAQRLFARVEHTIRDTIGEKYTGVMLDNIGLPSLNYNLAFNDGTFVAYNDGQILVTLKPGAKSTETYQRVLRRRLAQEFPDTIFYFQAADIITQILDFGVPSQIDIQVTGRHLEQDRAVAQDIERRLRGVVGAVDVHIQQILNAPEFFVQVNRERAAELNLTEQQVANNLNTSLSGSFQLNPNFWADPKTGIPYQLWVQTPEYRNTTLGDLENTPLLVASANGAAPVQLLSNVATLTRGTEQTVISHVNTQPTFDIYAAAQDRDLGGISADIQRIVRDESKQLTAPDKITVRGQIDSMNQAFLHIGIGLGVALIAVYLLMVVNFQSWGDPFVILAALPLAFCGIVASLFITQTTFSIPSLMGAIMSVGVASANSILLVTFAREHRETQGSDAVEAAMTAGETRLRPVLMTAGAMFVGLIPMAIGIGQGSEQNAALARAVLGGVAVGTCSTLIFVPFLYSVLRRGEARAPTDYV
jgi:multidrug efflux pump subunit AcrB